MEDAPSLLKNSEVRMSRYLDTSTTTQMDQIMVQHGRSGRSSRKEFVRSLFRRTLLKKQIKKVLLEHGWEKVSILGMFFVYRDKGLFLFCVCGRYQVEWKETTS